MKTRTLAAAVATLLCGSAMAAQDVIALKIDGLNVKGGLDVPGLEGQIELLTVSGAVSSTIQSQGGAGGGGSGKVTGSPYTLVKRVDASSPAFLLAVATGRHYQTATISFNRERNGGTIEYLRIVLSGVVVSSQTLNGSESHAARDTELLSLVYQKACLSYTPQLQNGAMGNEITTCFNFATNSPE